MASNSTKNTYGNEDGNVRDIGVGSDDWFRTPSLRTGQADLPHPALQLVVLPSLGLTSLGIGGDKGEQPMFGKECIGPAIMIVSSSSSFSAVTTPQNAAQPRAD